MVFNWTTFEGMILSSISGPILFYIHSEDLNMIRLIWISSQTILYLQSFDYNLPVALFHIAFELIVILPNASLLLLGTFFTIMI